MQQGELLAHVKLVVFNHMTYTGRLLLWPVLERKTVSWTEQLDFIFPKAEQDDQMNKAIETGIVLHEQGTLHINPVYAETLRKVLLEERKASIAPA